MDAFNAQVMDVCAAYNDAMALSHTRGLHTVSLDEQTGIQAIQRIAPDLLPRPGRIARREYEYKREMFQREVRLFGSVTSGARGFGEGEGSLADAEVELLASVAGLGTV